MIFSHGKRRIFFILEIPLRGPKKEGKSFKAILDNSSGENARSIIQREADNERARYILSGMEFNKEI